VVSLFDVEDVEQMPKVRDMTVGPVSTSDVREFVRRYHYIGSDSSAWRWGLWHGPVLYGVIGFNVLTANVSRSVFGDEDSHRVWHMTRLVAADASPRNSESRLIGGTLRAIERNHQHVWAVLTYAATDVGHIGYVYQATNALYTGLAAGGECYYLNSQGERQSRRTLDVSDYGGAPLAERARRRGWVRVDVPRKHRYVYILGNKAERRARRKLLRYPILPYPKVEGHA
jgi:hypothetical protein